jgi:hypothetical protein
MASFPLFPYFPREIQLAIWAFAAVLQDPEPEVCLVWPLNIESAIGQYARFPEQPVLPFIVDTAWPAVAHVCHAAREAALRFLPPRRRCRLRDVSDEALDEVRIARVPFEGATEVNGLPFRKHLENRRAGMDNHIRHFLVRGGDEGTAWSTADCCFSGLEIRAQTFVEYTRAENNEGQWVEVCGDRLLGTTPQDPTAPAPRRVPLANRKHPEEYRVLDDDSGWYSREEFLSDMEREYPEYYQNRSWR